MVHRVDKGGETESVGEEDELLADRRADLADFGEELDGVPAREAS